MEKLAATVRALSRGVILLLLSTISPHAQPDTASEPPVGTNPVVTPFKLQRGHIMVLARANGSEPRWFMLDTGYGTTMLDSALADALGLKRAGRITIVGIAGEEPANVFEGPTFELGSATWRPRRVAAFPASDASRTRQRDGIFGSSFFRRFVVEIDSAGKMLRLHQPKAYQYSGSGEVLPLAFKGSTPIVEATVRLPDQSSVKAQFEIDTGCTGSLCLGRHFVEAHQLVPTNSPSQDRRFGVGGGMRTRSGHLTRLQLGNVVITKPAADFFLDGSPVDPPLAGHIGWELLRDFKVIFDYAQEQMILERQK
jgi:predicted aspartyl protease